MPVITYSGFEANGVDSLFVRRDGGFLATVPAGAASFTDIGAAPGEHSYVVRWRPDGVRTDIPCSPSVITVPEAGFACQVSIDANGNPVLSWTDIGLSRYVVREANLGFVANVDGVNVYTDTARESGDYYYSIRLRTNGVTRDETCSPSPVTVPENGGGVVGDICTASAAANGDVTLEWSPIDGEDTYVVRDNDGFVATVSGLRFVDTGATSGQQTYVIRSRQAGITTNVTCNTVVVP